MKKAFTLIELLVVVLIIGILAAVALPQYQKAVEKSRIAAALPVMDGIKTNMDMWLLENGYPTSKAFFIWGDNFSEGLPKAETTLDIKGLNGSLSDGNFFYEAVCFSHSCSIDAYRSSNAYNNEGDYWLNMYLPDSTNQWEYACIYFDDFGQCACNTLQGQGNWEIINGNE